MIMRQATSPLAADLKQVIARTENLWGVLRGRSVFITGGTGFFGRWLLESFSAANRQLNLGAQAIVLARDPEKFRTKAADLLDDDSIQPVQGDVRSLDLSRLMAQFVERDLNPLSHVIHAASETTVAANRDHPATVIETSLEGTRRTLEFAHRMGATNFLLVSSGAVYGPQPVELSHIPESFSGSPSVASPMSAYGEGKRVAELLCNIHARNHALNCRIARCFAFVGPHLALDAHYAIGNFIRDALAGETIRVNGDGTPFRSYLYAADLATWLWTLLLHPDASGTYNVGSDVAYSIFQTAEAVARHAPSHIEINVAQRPDLQQRIQRYVPDIRRARSELKLEAWTQLDSALNKTLQFHQTIK